MEREPGHQNWTGFSLCSYAAQRGKGRLGESCFLLVCILLCSLVTFRGSEKTALCNGSGFGREHCRPPAISVRTGREAPRLALLPFSLVAGRIIGDLQLSCIQQSIFYYYIIYMFINHGLTRYFTLTYVIIFIVQNTAYQGTGFFCYKPTSGIKAF